MPKIPSVRKFKGDNEISFQKWILQFNAQIAALGVAADKKNEVLLCCLDDCAFTAASAEIAADANITFDNLVNALKTTFSGEDYKRNVESKLRNLKFSKGTNINNFCNTLRTFVKELYGLDNANAVDAIAINHVMPQLDEEIRRDVKILQLTGNKNLERLLELVDDKLSGNPLLCNNSLKVSAVETGDRFSKIVNLIDVLSVKVDTISRDHGRDQVNLKCKNCGKNNHDEKQCFKLKTCFKCHKKGHISRYCRENTGNISAANIPQVCNIEPAKRVLLKVKIGGKEFTFLHDTGSQFSIITRKTYESIPVRPPLQNVDKNGIGIDGSNFKFDGIVYLNLSLLKHDDTYCSAAFSR